VNDARCTPLLVAAEEGHEAVLAVLIKAGGVGEISTIRGITDVHLCLWLCKMTTGQC
jgi:hypothetical protein